MSQKKKRGRNTVLVRTGLQSDAQHGAIVPPIHLSTTYAFEGYGRMGRYDYGRLGNPTRDVLAETIAKAEGGHGAVITSSGMAAILLVLTLLKQGDTIVMPHDCYGGTWRMGEALKAKGHYKVVFADLTQEKSLAKALALKPKMVLIETPSNPILRITDLETVIAKVKKAGALAVADNTFLSPALQRPLAFGADIVLHSTTKFINGHTDVIGGAVVSATPALHEELKWWGNNIGIIGSPFDSYLTLRGIRTLDVRVRRQCENAQAIAEMLAAHPAVERVYYPGLPSHPGHTLARKQQSGFGAMLSFEVRGGEPQIKALLEGLDCFSLAESLGGVESLISHSASMTHAAMSPQARAVAGISDQLVRLSVGIEDAADLIGDLKAGLKAAQKA